MPEKFLDSADIRALGQQLASEGIPESVRVRVLDSSDGAETLNGAPHIFRAAFHLPTAGPKEIVRILGWKSHQSFHGIGMKLDLEWHSGLRGADGEVAGGLVHSRAAEPSYVASA